ncbi:hypothetical protein BDZ91DRAFT_796713 [Kalaharituber pfeilii]|nr:hypothetical protein BDZ91DRAFT_796713 [Kalaharituber pfeilii]
MDPDYEEQRVPRSLADMLGLRVGGLEWETPLDTTSLVPRHPAMVTGKRSVNELRLGAGMGSAQEMSVTAGGGELRPRAASFSTSEMDGVGASSRALLRGSSTHHGHQQAYSTASEASASSYSSLSATTSGTTPRPAAPQQQLRYSSLLDVDSAPLSSQSRPVPQQSTYYTSLLNIDSAPRRAGSERPHSAGCDTQGAYLANSIGVHRSTARFAIDNENLPEEELPTYEEAMAAPVLPVPLIAEAERQVPTPISHSVRAQRRHQRHESSQQASSSSPSRAKIGESSSSTNWDQSPSSSTAASSSSSSWSSSRLARLLRRRHSSDYVRPPPPQEGVPLELVVDRFGNRKREIIIGGTKARDRELWLASLGPPKRGIDPLTMGFAQRCVRWERRNLRRNDMSLASHFFDWKTTFNSISPYSNPFIDQDAEQAIWAGMGRDSIKEIEMRNRLSSKEHKNIAAEKLASWMQAVDLKMSDDKVTVPTKVELPAWRPRGFALGTSHRSAINGRWDLLLALCRLAEDSTFAGDLPALRQWSPISA